MQHLKKAIERATRLLLDDKEIQTHLHVLACKLAHIPEGSVLGETIAEIDPRYELYYAELSSLNSKLLAHVGASMLLVDEEVKRPEAQGLGARLQFRSASPR